MSTIFVRVELFVEFPEKLASELNVSTAREETLQGEENDQVVTPSCSGGNTLFAGENF